MATSTRRRSSGKKRRSLSKWWTDFQKTGRYRIVVWIARKTGWLIVKIGYRPGANDKLKSGAKRVGGNVGSRVSGFGHGRLDKRELRAGVMTDEEYAAYERIVLNRPSDVSEEEARANWLELMLQARCDRRAGFAPPAPAPVSTPQPAFQPPAPRQQAGRSPVQPVRPVLPSEPGQPMRPGEPVPSRPAQPVPSRRPATRKVNRSAQLRAAWGSKFDNMKGPAMAADGNLSGAMAQLRAFVDQQPGDRMQLHAQLAAFAQFFEGLGEIAEAMQATLGRPLPDGTPGVPSSVTQHLGPVAEHGAQIGQCAKDTALAFEDRFAEAIKVAQDAEKPSDEYLRAPA